MWMVWSEGSTRAHRAFCRESSGYFQEGREKSVQEQNFQSALLGL